MTFPEYLYRMKAFNLSRIDRERDMHWQAWLSVMANSTEKKGDKTVSSFKTFKDFFDYEKAINEIDKPKSNLSDKNKQLARIAARLNKQGRR